jgi:hypothetical protein
MKLGLRIGIGCALLASGLISTAVAPARPNAVGCKPEAGKRIVLTRRYRFTLLIGNVENMYMPRQVRANHLKHGEEMLRGTMTSGAALTGGPIRHLEVQICERSTRVVVTNATPRIVVDDRTKRKALVLPVSVMEGIGEGVADLHYGNNIAMPRKHRFLVAVTWIRERASFSFVSR